MNINLSNSEILQYICLMTVLSYIWKTSNIKLLYIFPFLIFMIIFYKRETTKQENITNNNDKIVQIKKELFDEEYEFLIDEEILYYIDSIKIMKRFNGPVFNVLLSQIDDYYQHRTISYLLLVLETYQSLYFVLPIELFEFYTEKHKELKNILYDILKEKKHITVEMQSYLPKNYIHNNI